MVDIATINSVIEAFIDWQQPWKFYEFVAGHAELGEGERKVLDAIWSAACDRHLWLSGTFQECCTNADKAIAQQFPWLSVRARQQIINGAAYEWR